MGVIYYFMFVLLAFALLALIYFGGVYGIAGAVMVIILMVRNSKTKGRL